MLKKQKKINQKVKTVFMQWIYFENPPSHMDKLGKVDAYSEPPQIPKVDLLAIAAVNGFKSLTVLTNSSTSDAWQCSEFIFARCCT